MTAPRQPRRPRLWSLQTATLMLAVVAALGWLIYRTRGSTFQWQRFVLTLRVIDGRWLAVSILLILLTNIGRAVRWEVMLRPWGQRPGVLKLSADTIIGYAAVALLGRVGEVVRPYLIANRAGLPLSSQAAAWVLEHTLDLLAMLLLFGGALLRVPARAHLGPEVRWVLDAGGYFFALVGAICLVLFIAFRNFSEPARQRILSALTFLPPESQQRAGRMLEAFSQGVESTRDRRLLALLVVYTGVVWAMILGSAYALLLGFPATRQFRLVDVMVLVGFASFGNLIQLPGVGGGTQVASIVVLTEMYGLSLDTATGIALVIWAISSVVIVPFGLLCAFQEGLTWGKLKLLSTKQIMEDQRS